MVLVEKQGIVWTLVGRKSIIDGCQTKMPLLL